jgi:hypothetical protein
MKLTRKLIVPVIAAAGLLAGTPAAFAAASPAAGTARAVAVPDVFKWLYYGPFPTLHACQVQGDKEVNLNGSYTFKCIEYSEGEYLIWKLFIGVPE